MLEHLWRPLQVSIAAMRRARPFPGTSRGKHLKGSCWVMFTLDLSLDSGYHFKYRAVDWQPDDNYSNAQPVPQWEAC